MSRLHGPLFLLILIQMNGGAGWASDRYTSRIDSCNSVFHPLLKSVQSVRASIFGAKSFASDFRKLIEKKIPRESPPVTSEYFDHVYREWVTLQDPGTHLSVLKYPVPEVAVEALGVALRQNVNPAQIAGILKDSWLKGTAREILVWMSRILEHPEFKEGPLLRDLVSEYSKTESIYRSKIKYVTGVPSLPEPKPGHVRMYKGTHFYRGPARSQSQVGKSWDEVEDGGIHFLEQWEANIHSVRAEAFHPDGVSVSTDKTIPIHYGSHVRIYDVPEEVVAKLPRGAPELSEYVFKYSVPERFRVRTLPRATYLELLKIHSRRAGAFREWIQRTSLGNGPGVLEVFLQSEPLLVRGRRIDYSEVMSARMGVDGRTSFRQSARRGFERMKTVSTQYRWDEIQAPPNVDVQAVFRFSFAFLNLGRALAVRFQTSRSEIVYEVLPQLMNKAGFSKSEVDLGCALAGNEVLEVMIQGGLTPQGAFERLVEISKRTNLNARDYFKIQSFFHAMDAQSVSEEEVSRASGEEALLPLGDKFKVLWNLFESVEVRH